MVLNENCLKTEKKKILNLGSETLFQKKKLVVKKLFAKNKSSVALIFIS